MSKRTLPVLETEMTKDYYTIISLASGTERIVATLPKEYMDAVVAQWQAFQNGTSTEDHRYSRNYAGCWPVQGTMSFVHFAKTGITEMV